MSNFEKRVFDGLVSKGQTQRNKKKRYIGPYDRHDLQFKQRRLSGWVDSVKSNSNSVLGDMHDMSDFDSGDSTFDSDDIKAVNKLIVTTRKKNRIKDIWLTCNESKRLGARCQYPCDWKVWLSKKLNDSNLVIKTISRKHKNYLSCKKIKTIKSSWLAKVLQDWFSVKTDLL
ncbi:hypothetical protein LIER_32556 [Lithospermum erythrorhizon]|uniref:Uncharacterized protein n=1 Tax=Lithospermum erythrorhizon TaxID=34254 RepID=A0AAV3RU68_LITER